MIISGVKSKMSRLKVDRTKGVAQIFTCIILCVGVEHINIIGTVIFCDKSNSLNEII